MLKFLVITALLAHSCLALTYPARKGYTQQQQQQQEEDTYVQEEEPTYQAPAAPAAPTKTYQKPKAPYAPAPAQPAVLAVNSKRKVQYVEVASNYAKEEPLTVEVPAATSQVNFILRSRSSPVNIEAYHEGGKGSYKETSSEDAPEVRVHTVTKPIYQEVREIIAPYRKIQQQIQPVQEIRESQIAKSQPAAYPESKPAYTQPAKPTYTAPKPTYTQPKKPAVTYAPKPKQAAYAKPKLVYTQPKQTYDQPKAAPQAGYAKPASPSYQSKRRYTDTY